MTKKYLTKTEILGANDLQREEVEVPEWGGTVLIRSFTADAKDAMEHKLFQISKTGVGIRAAYVGLALVDDKGQRLFKDEEISMLGTKYAGAVDRIFEKVARLNRITQQDVEDLEKNSGAVLGDGLPSASV